MRGWRRWLHRRGLLYSPSNGFLYEQGTLLRPGRNLWDGFADRFADEIRRCPVPPSTGEHLPRLPDHR